MNIAMHHPAEFGVIESWSGYVLASPIARIFGHDPRVLDDNSPMLSVAGVSPILRAEHAYIWFYVGTDDPLLRQNQQFAAELRTLGIAHAFFTGSGAHSWGLWRRFIDQALMVAANHLSH